MNKYVIILEASEDKNKDETGFRKDTAPIIKAVQDIGINCKAIHFTLSEKDKIFDFMRKNCVAYISRVNPGKLTTGEQTYFDFLDNLIDEGIVGIEPPSTLLALGSKSSLCKLVGTGLVPDDMRIYKDKKELIEDFDIESLNSDRVFKQNRGSSGKGIFRLGLVDSSASKIRVTDAQNNRTQNIHINDFIDNYVNFDSGVVVNMPFLSGIKEGEYRVLLVGNTPCYVIHKKPTKGDFNFSTTLHSGSEYKYEDVSKHPILIDLVTNNIETILTKLNDSRPAPLIWSIDFIRDIENDKFLISEINCNCLGFTSLLDSDIPKLMADMIYNRIYHEHN
ncbi:Cj0069 family protein [Aliivibrio fischeri]|uniref:Cj0069 family protein n=1 Tax=Aliivibrio fischeri TaxID=668 RepID=UPI0012DA3EFB|nr:Cj0069 family protein [Aliivibrio fischeri]MUL16230.1 Cj0069 family protein [Aliivibrio fischeri]